MMEAGAEIQCSNTVQTAVNQPCGACVAWRTGVNARILPRISRVGDSMDRIDYRNRNSLVLGSTIPSSFLSFSQ
jgi:hypothetical protein